MRRILKPIFPKVLCKALGMILIVGLGAVQAQEVSIAQGGTYTGCDFFFVDNGLTSGDASPNADFTMTFCPDMVSNPVISFYFNLFALGEGDVMNVWFSDEAVRCTRWGIHRLRFARSGHLEPDGRRDQRFGMHYLAVYF